MSVGSLVRLLALAAVVALGLTGCFGGPRTAMTAVDAECSAGAAVTESLIDSGGARHPALAPDLAALGEVASPDVREAAEELATLADMEEPSATVRTTWYAALGDLDRALLDRCDFSIRALVTESGLSSDSTDDSEGSHLETVTDSVADVDHGTSSPLDWEEVRSRIHAAGWVDRGYRGIVGLDPGIHVTVYGVETAQLALTVCGDTHDALAPEASTTEVTVEVHGLHEGMLAHTISGACVLR